MPITDNIVSSPVGIHDVQRALGVSSGDLATLCTSSKINIFSKHKPNELTGYEQPSASALETAGYGVSAIATTSRSSLATMELGWTYHGAEAPYYRLLDFNHYYHDAPIPFLQANGPRLIVDAVSFNTAPVLFYMFMSDGALANKPFSRDSGIGTSGTAVPADHLAYCIAVEDLGFDAGGGTYESIMGAYLGLVIFQGTTYKAELWASTPVAELSQRENGMFIIPTSDLALARGEYTAVACAKKVVGGLTYYLPVFDHADYPARFTLEVGGLDYYRQNSRGVAISADGNPARLLPTTASTVYVFVRLTNESPNTLYVEVGNNVKFTMVCTIKGSVEDAFGQHTISRTVTTAAIYRPSTDQTVASGGHVDLVYQITNIWNYDGGTTQPSLIESGSIRLTPTLTYNGTDAYPPGGRVIGITYGS